MDNANDTNPQLGHEGLGWDGGIKAHCLRISPITVRNKTLAAFPLQLFNRSREDVQVNGIEVQIVQLGVYGMQTQELGAVLSYSARALIAERRIPITGVDNFLVYTALLVPSGRAKIVTVRQKVDVEKANCDVVFSLRLFYDGGTFELVLPGILVEQANICKMGILPEHGTFQIDNIGAVSFENGLYLVNCVDYKMYIAPERFVSYDAAISFRTTPKALRKEVKPGCEHFAGKFVDIRMHSLTHEVAERIADQLTVHIVGCKAKSKDTLFELSLIPASEQIEVTLYVRVEKIYDRVYLYLIRKFGALTATWQKDFRILFL